MALHEKELLDALASTKILTAMITPAVLISACGTLIFSTSGRLGRLYDRVNSLKSELEATLAGRHDYPDERLDYIADQLSLQRTRAGLIQKSLAALYTATLLFIAASLAVALNIAYGDQSTSWLPTLIALAGGGFLFAASALLLYESRYNLRFIFRHLDFVSLLHSRARRPS